jgi:hypothetical protein
MLYPRAFQCFKRSEFPTTETEDIAIAAPATTGFKKPKAARGMPMML